jgi:hypothetical protein
MTKQNLLNGSVLSMLFIATILIFNSCKKDKNNLPSSNPNGSWSNSTMTKATFLGQVIKEDGSPLDGAIVSTGSHMMTSDADGFFYFSNISTPLNATLIRVEKAGYFKAFRTVKVIPNQDNQVRIMAMELPTPESLNAATGGIITVGNGGSIEFPANAIIDANTNQPYTGNVSVYAKWIDPSGDDLAFLMPGALRGINEDGDEEGLTTYGMQTVELVGGAGQKLQLGNGKMAQVSFPLPPSIVGSAPLSIPLWHFDETEGMWVENGKATKTGSEYLGSVSHFSSWNCDIGGPTVNLTCTLVDVNNNPLPGVLIKITNPNFVNTAHGLTNSSGMINGPVPANLSLDLYAWFPGGCTGLTLLQSFTTSSSNLNLGTISVPSNVFNTSVVSGTVVDCNNLPLANAPIKLNTGTHILFTTTNALGAYSFSVTCLTGSVPAVLTAYDVTNAVNGSGNITIAPNGTFNAGTLQACGSLNQFINWSSTVGMTTTNFSIMEGAGGINFYQNWLQVQNETRINANDNSNQIFIRANFDGPQSVGGSHNLTYFWDHLDSASALSGIPVNVTSYPAVGGFIEGNFSGTVNNGTFIPTRTINCTFRITRQQ